MIFPYFIRNMAGIVVVEVICIILFHVWPEGTPPQHFDAGGQEPVVTQLQPPVITIQDGSSGGSPQRENPLPPVPVPNDQPLKQEVNVDLNKYFSSSTNSSKLSPPGGGGSGNAVVGNPDVSPRVTRIVEPTYHAKLDHKYLIKVKFLVDKKGNVDKATIIKIYRLSQSGKRQEKVQHINPKVEKAVIKAAMNWKFNPAREHGEPVRAYTKNYFTV